ncbi:MAG TPA: hypothetical protein VEC99_15455 [Clostridia bacterium]|nr:hypothetical protein [Clostridia bacterium]
MSVSDSFNSFTARLRDFICSSMDEQGKTGVACSDRESIHAARREDTFNQLALALFGLQFEHNSAYRRFCQNRGASPKTVERWSEIPAIPTFAFKDLELSCIPANQRTAVFFSSGTTEQRPSRHFHSPESLAIYEASLLPWFNRHLLSSAEESLMAGANPSAEASPALPREPLGRSRASGCSMLALTPSADEAPNSSLVHMFTTIERELLFNRSAFTGRVLTDGAWAVDLHATIEYLRQITEAGDRVLVLGTAFSFVHLLDFLAEHHVRLMLPAGSRVLETGGYKGRSRALPKAELHSLITAWLSIPSSHIVCEYGMSELSSQAYDLVYGSSYNTIQSPARRFQLPPWAQVQIVSPETGRLVSEGEAGLIRICDLANVFSVMAIQTEDLAVRHGYGFELIGRATQAEPRGCSLMAS